MCVLLLFMPLLLAGGVAGVNNPTIDDNGNIVWPPLPVGKSYLTEGITANTGGLSPFYSLSRSFIGSSLPETLPLDTVKGIFDGSLSIGDEWQNLLKPFVGFVLCLVIGIFFFLIFPLVGLCFCCCRCCGNCGGKMMQKKHPSSTCRRRTFIGILVVLVAFQGAGVICTYVINDQLSDNLKSTPEVANNIATDLMTFVENTDQQFHQIIFDNIDFVKSTVKNDTQENRISTMITEPLVQRLNRDFSLDGILTSIKRDVDSATRKVDSMETSLAAMQAATPSVPASVRTPLKTNLAAVENSISSLKKKLDVSLIDDMQDMVKTKLQTGVNTAMKRIDVQSQINDMMTKNVDTIQTSIVDALKEANASIQNLNIKDSTADSVKLISTYDKYRNYAGIGIASILLIIVLLQVFGLAFGVFGFNSDTEPTERGCVPNAGGNMLMASVGFLFIFGAIIMLLTTCLYGTGSVVERYGCQLLKHPARIEQYAHALMSTETGNMKFKFKGKQLNFSLSGILSACEKGHTLYDAFHLENAIDIRQMLKQVEGYKSTIIPTDFDKHLDLTNLNLSASTGQLGAQITQLNGSKTQLDTVDSKLNDLKTLLKSLSVQGTMITNLNKLGTSVMQLRPIIGKLPNTLTILQNKLTTMDSKLSKNAEKYINESVGVFTGHIFGIFESFVNDTIKHLHTDLGSCRTVWSIYNVLLLETICHGIIDPLNGFWLALGWNMFFGLPSLIISVKLAKYFRRMKYVDDIGDNISEGGTRWSNKVGHQDI